MNHIAHDALLTPKQAAERLNVSYQTIGRLIRNGDIEAVKVGSQYRIHPTTINELIGRPPCCKGWLADGVNDSEPAPPPAGFGPPE